MHRETDNSDKSRPLTNRMVNKNVKDKTDDQKPSSVLMICYYFPPILASGVSRSVGFATELPGFHWQPHILTVTDAMESWESNVKVAVPENLRITRSPEFNLSGFLDLLQGLTNRLYRFVTRRNLDRPVFRRIFGMPDAHIAWFYVLRAIRLARETECLYVSCTPFSSAVLALFVKAITKKPLVVDFRDPWTIYLHTRKDRWLEKRVIAGCDRLILNTDETLQWYQQAYPQFAHKLLCIPNGFNKRIYADRDNRDMDKITIVHAGSFYLDRKPDLLLQAMELLGDSRLKFIQVGDGTPSLRDYAHRLNIEVTGKLPPEQAHEYIAKADILYLKQGLSINECIAAKTYEYLTTGRPILAECAESADAKIIRRYASASEIVSVEDIDLLLQALGRIVDVASNHDEGPSAEYLDKYNRHALTARLAQEFDRLRNGHNSQ